MPGHDHPENYRAYGVLMRDVGAVVFGYEECSCGDSIEGGGYSA